MKDSESVIIKIEKRVNYAGGENGKVLVSFEIPIPNHLCEEHKKQFAECTRGIFEPMVKWLVDFLASMPRFRSHIPYALRVLDFHISEASQEIQEKIKS